MRQSLHIRGLITRSWRLVTDVMLSAAAISTVVIVPLINTRALDAGANVRGLLQYIIVYTAISIVALTFSKTYRMIWRYVSFRDLLVLIQAASLTMVVFTAVVLLLLQRSDSVPVTLMLTTFALIWFVNICFLAAPRLVSRALSEARILGGWRNQFSSAPIPALITGDVERMEAFIRESSRNASSRHRIVGVLTEDGSLGGSYLHGVQVLGDIHQLPNIVTHMLERGIRVDTLILARDNATRRNYEELLESAGPIGLKVGRLPPHGAFQDRTVVQPIELADLLGRPEVTIDAAAVTSMIEGKAVVVTGAGGSIGSELIRQIARLKPEKLVMIDFCEFNLYSIDRELSETHPNIPREAAILDVRDGDLIGRLIERVKPDIMFHAAALKHVPLLETQPVEAVKTNVVGTVNVAEACNKHGVATMVTISTDKAVNPTNVMGATKRLAEAYCQGLDQAAIQSGGTRFITVRFGNVLGSAGSVVPLFQRQIEAGGPVTITHAGITRYFMTIPEAVTLVMQAGAHGKGLNEERGNIYVLEMGQPVKIIDLARQMIRLSGHKPDEDIKISVIGLRPGEKLYEEVVHSDESIMPTKTKSIMKVAPRITDLRIVRQQVQELRQACGNVDAGRVLRLLRVSVPEFDASENASQFMSR